MAAMRVKTPHKCFTTGVSAENPDEAMTLAGRELAAACTIFSKGTSDDPKQASSFAAASGVRRSRDSVRYVGFSGERRDFIANGARASCLRRDHGTRLIGGPL